MAKSKYKRITDCKLHVGEKWCYSWLVTYPVSYRYNGGIIVDGKLYDGFEVSPPKVPKGFKLVSIGCGLQMNARPPYATSYLQPIGDKVISKATAKAACA